VKNKAKRKTKDITSVSNDECMIQELREDPEFAIEYLKVAFEDVENPGVLLIALRRIAEARGGIAKVAKAAGIERESLYRALSAKGNPRLSTLRAVTQAVGLRLTVESARAGSHSTTSLRSVALSKLPLLAKPARSGASRA
jgi:probable addiction module antidote protein